MRVCVALNETFTRHRGRVYASLLGYKEFWSRYLMAFDGVLVLARVRDLDALEDGMVESTGPGVQFFALPAFHGPWEFLAMRWRLQRLVARAIDQADAFVLRVPSHIGSLAWRELCRRRWPYAVEVVGDPWLSLAPGSVKSVVRPIVRWLSPRSLRRQCRGAIGASYVTADALQRSYSPSPSAYTIACSSIDLPEEHILEDLSGRLQRIDTLPERLRGGPAPVRLGFIGTLRVLYKAPDVHIEALELCRRRGMNVELVMIGEGPYRGQMRSLAQRKGVAQHVQLPGRLPPGRPVMEFLDRVDLFLNASRQEGLPRALIEAMARGCPSVGSDVGGIPELLDASHLVSAGDPTALAACIERVLGDRDALRAAALRNRNVAKQYGRAVLNERRRGFYRYVRQRTFEIRGSGLSSVAPRTGSSDRQDEADVSCQVGSRG